MALSRHLDPKSASQNLHDASKIDRKTKNAVLGYIRRVQNLLPNDSPYFNIIDFIKHLILFYYADCPHHFEIKAKISDTTQGRIYLGIDLITNKAVIIHEAWKSLIRNSVNKFNNFLWHRDKKMQIAYLLNLPPGLFSVKFILNQI